MIKIVTINWNDNIFNEISHMMYKFNIFYSNLLIIIPK